MFGLHGIATCEMFAQELELVSLAGPHKRIRFAAAPGRNQVVQDGYHNFSP